MNKNEITLDTLYNFMKSKFGSIDNRLDNMDKRFDTMDNRLDNMDKRFDAIDNRLDNMDKRFDAMDNRLDNMDIRITRIEADNQEAHAQILKELQRNSNALTKFEAEFNDKISILFDAYNATKERMYLFGKQQLRFSEQLENLSNRVSALEKNAVLSIK